MRSPRQIVVTCLCLSGSLFAVADNDDTTSRSWVTYGPYGGQVTSLVSSCHPEGGVYATLLGHGVFHLSPEARAWTNISSTLENQYVYSIAQSPADGEVLFAATNYGVYATFDGGQHWERRSGGISAWEMSALAFDPQNPQTIYSGGVWEGDWSVYKTTDGGLTWDYAGEGIPGGVEIRAIVVDPVNTNVVYAAVDYPYGSGVDPAGVYKSINGGSTWEPTGDELSDKDVTCLTMDPSDHLTLYAGVYAFGTYDGGVYVSHDAGASWTRSSSGLPDDLEVHGIAIGGGDVDPPPMYAAVAYAYNIAPSPPDSWEARLYKSVNGGQSWQRFAEGIVYPNMTGVAVDPDNPGTVYTGTDRAGVFRSTDAAGHWAHHSTGLELLAADDIAVDPGDPRVLFVTAQSKADELDRCDAGVFTSTDSGRTWSPRAQGIHFTGGFWTAAVAVAPPVDSTDTSTVYAAHCGWNGYRSMDGGNNWIWCGGTGGITGFWTRDVVVDPVNPWIIYMAAAGFEPSWPDVFKSEDYGYTWRSTADNLIWAEFMSLAIDPTDTRIVYAGSGWEGVWKTVDGGERWTHTGSEIDGPRVGALIVDPHNPRMVYAADCAYDGTGFYYSEDGGDHWRQSNDGLTTLQVWDIALRPTSDDVIPMIYAGTGGGGVFWRDGEGRWAPMNEGLKDLTVWSLAVASNPLGTVNSCTLFAGTTSGVYRRVITGFLDAEADAGHAAPTRRFIQVGEEPADDSDVTRP